MRRPLGRALTALLAGIGLLMSTAGLAVAAEYRAGDRVTLGADETIGEDLYVAAGTVVIDGIIDGDLTVASGTVVVRGTVNGSVNTAGGDVNVSGNVGESIRSIGGNVAISGEVGRDVVVAGANVVIQEGATVGGDVAGAAGTSASRGA